MGLADLFKFSIGRNKADGLDEIFPLSIKMSDFVQTYLQTIYTKILTDAYARTTGIPEDSIPVLFDNCLGSETPDGLISLLAKAMASKGDLYLIYNPQTKTLRRADGTEQAAIKDAYKSGKQIKGQVYVSFTNNNKSDMIRFYSEIEFATTAGLYKQSQLSSAIQYKMNELRATVSSIDKAAAESQAKAINESLVSGRNAIMDAKDVIDTTKVDVDPISKALDMIESKLSMYIGMPKSYFTGDQTNGMGDTGNADARAVERGLTAYFFSVAKPVVEALLECKTTFRTQDFSQVMTGLSALQTFDLVGNKYISDENKLAIANALLGVESKLGADPVGANTDPLDQGLTPKQPKQGATPPARSQKG